MKPKRAFCAVLLLALCLPTLAVADDERDHHADPAMVAARQKFFGAENVNSETGRVSGDKVILSWITNASVAL